MRFVVTGGAGYVGSHLVVELLQAGHEVVVVDDLSKGHPAAVERAGELAGRPAELVVGDVGDASVIRGALAGADGVFHLAASKQVGESMDKPGLYFRNNVGAMAVLIEEMERAGVRRMVFSSTAAVYGGRHPVPLAEHMTPEPDSPYGRSKVQGEEMLAWMAQQCGWAAISLRYFNPVGAHPSGRIGEPMANAASLVPRALVSLTRDLVAPGSDVLTVFGTDYDTPDGTAQRDYIHIGDIARAHLDALRGLEEPGHTVFNVGSGRPWSVREVLDSCERVIGMRVPHVDGARRPGDVPVSLADPGRFKATFGFEAEYTLDDMVGSAWNWWKSNPEGYTS